MDKKEIELMADKLNKQLEELSKIRKENAQRHSEMSERELVESLIEEYEGVCKDAVKNDINIEILNDEGKNDD